MSEFSDQVVDASRELRTKEDLMTYYQSRYPKNWNQRLSTDLRPFLPLTKSGQQQSIKNIERRHQARQGRGVPKSTRATSAQYKALGEQIGPIPPKNGYHVKFRGTLKISDNCTDKEREIDEVITGDAAKRLASTGDFGIVLDAYGGGFEDICEIFDMSVTAAAPGATGKPHQHAAHGPTKYLQYLKK